MIEPPARRRWILYAALGLLALLGLGAAAAGVIGLVQERTRKPTATEKSTAATKEQALRWRIRAVSEVFPPVVKNPSGANPAYRVGVAPSARCADALDPAAARALAAGGCQTVLRATYTDASRTLLTTVGVAVMRDPSAASSAASGLAGTSTYDASGVRALPFAGTVAARYDDGARQVLTHQTITSGPYVFLLASGWADGRPKLAVATDLDERFYKSGHNFVGGSKRIDGTLLASFIAGAGPSADSPFAIRGLAPAADILPVRIVPDSGESGWDGWWDGGEPLDAMVRGIRYAADQGAGVILVGNRVWSNSDATGLQAAVDYARGKNAVVVVGNGPLASDAAPLPASLPGVIGVAALDTDGTRWAKWSLQGSPVLVSAPGFKLPSTGPGNTPYLFWGPEPAAAWVAATAALVKSQYPTLTPGQVADAITTGAHHPKEGYNTLVGFGTIDPGDALKVAKNLAKAPYAATARPVLPDASHFNGSPARIAAVHPSTGKMAAFWGLTTAGLAITAAALTLLIRTRRRPLPTSPLPDPPGATSPEFTPPETTSPASAPSELASSGDAVPESGVAATDLEEG